MLLKEVYFNPRSEYQDSLKIQLAIEALEECVYNDKEESE